VGFSATRRTLTQAPEQNNQPGGLCVEDEMPLRRSYEYKERPGGERNEARIREKTGRATSYKFGKRPGGKRKCGPILVRRCGTMTTTAESGSSIPAGRPREVICSGDCERTSIVGRPAKQGFAHMEVWMAARNVCEQCVGLASAKQGFAHPVWP
jgi:hypothetical protein